MSRSERLDRAALVESGRSCRQQHRLFSRSARQLRIESQVTFALESRAFPAVCAILYNRIISKYLAMIFASASHCFRTPVLGSIAPRGYGGTYLHIWSALR